MQELKQIPSLIYQKLEYQTKRINEEFFAFRVAVIFGIFGFVPARNSRSAKAMTGELVGLFIFGLIVYLIYAYVYPFWTTTVSPYFSFAGTYALALSTIVLFMLVGYGLIRYGKGHKGLPS